MKVPEHLLKINIPGKIPTDPAAKNNREDGPHFLQFLIRNALTSARINMYIALIETRQKTHHVRYRVMDTTLRSVRY